MVAPAVVSVSGLRQKLHLDFGQADFSVKSCSICRMQYAPGEPKDERTHAAYHAAVLTGIRFQGWQTERVVRHCPGGSRILLVQQADPPAHWRKVREVTKFMEEQLGFAATWIMSVPAPIFLRSSRRVIASCGVRAIWVSRLCARQGIATMLLDAARCSCIPGYIMPKGELAFSNLSEDGMGLASSYSGVEGIIQIYEAG
ncbi:hypothetical protein WJX84_008140 [Apatococcus fuscideae]|uniref:N-acetyltransferase ESCO2 n=1 Tax=Apatococcus fuscideae TaxID=2026836 RepID=A0AAW1SSU0_9CHLO